MINCEELPGRTPPFRHKVDQTYTIALQAFELREKYCLTQVELAKASDVPQSQISRIERGAISPTATTLAKIAAALNADIRLVERQTA